MKTDKQVYRIFESVPDWIFELAGLPSPGQCTLRSVTVKALERHADGVIVPEASDQPLTVIEFQFQEDQTIYTRVVAEMVAVQEAARMRPVQGIIFFGYNDLDPRTQPWTRVVRTFVLREMMVAFEQSHPGHPLVAVFKPLLADSDDVLEREAVGYYRAIKTSHLPDGCRTSLLEVFVSWLEQRFCHRGKKEIEIMLLGELPALEETQSGKDLIRIGEERGERRGEQRGEQRGERRGEQRGLQRALLVSLRACYGRVPPAIADTVGTLTADEVERVLEHLPQCPTIDALAQWIASLSRET